MIFKKFDLTIKDKILPYNKTISVDADKSISIRSFLIGAISKNISKAYNVLESDDVLSTIRCLKKLGVKILKKKPGKYLIYGKGLGSFYARENTELFFGNSGTLARLIIGILSTTPRIKVRINGDHSLNKRSMKNLINIMTRFGATFLPKKKYNFPLKLISSEMPIGINYNAGVSAQLKSAVILAGLNSFGSTKVIETKESRDHTENILRNDKKILNISNKKKRIINVFGKKELDPININVPNDPSSAAFFSALTLLNKKSSLTIKNVGLNSKRIGFYQLLKNQGANIKFKNLKKNNNETSGDILIKSHKLKPINASKSYYTIMTDEYPILFAMSALIKGVSKFSGIGDLTNKESNRIKEMQNVLKQIDVKTKILKDGFIIYGKGMIDASKKIIKVPNLGDHRICMSAFILAILTGAQTNIKNFETVFTSSPSFLKIMKSLGAKFEIQKKK